MQLQVTRGVLQLLQCTGCSSEAGRGRTLQLVTATVSITEDGVTGGAEGYHNIIFSDHTLECKEFWHYMSG